MSNRSEITKTISRALERHINPKLDTRVYYAKEVTFDYGSAGECRIDYMQFQPIDNSVSGIEQGRFTAYEIKSCMADYNSGHGTNWGIADLNYIVTIPDVWDQVSRKIPHWVGCFIFLPSGQLECIRKAKRHYRTKPCSEMLLMMFRSANRELIKRGKSGRAEAGKTADIYAINDDDLGNIADNFTEHCIDCKHSSKEEGFCMKHGFMFDKEENSERSIRFHIICDDFKH